MVKTLQGWWLNPARLAAGGFLGLILVGTLLLKLPWSHNLNHLAWVDAFFTATSAVCVTGLVTLDTGKDFSGLGQCIVLALIQLGGLGMMVWSGGVVLFLGGKLSLRDRADLVATLPGVQLSRVGFLLRGAVVFTLVCEVLGAACLWACWAGQLGIWEALPLAVFHSVSAFCNAGFSLWSDSLIREQSNVAVTLIISLLVILGGLGVLLLADLWQSRRQARRLTLHTRIALTTTACLLLLGTLGFLALEWQNPQTLGGRDWLSAFCISWFQSMTTRTAGFNSVELGQCQPATLTLMMMLMLIGGCPGSTAGGLKTTTFFLLLVSSLSILKGENQVTVWERRIPTSRVLQSLAIFLIFFSLIWLGVMVLCHLEPHSLRDNLFEVVSAVATVGLSTGITGQLHEPSKWLLCLLMFVGRVGPLTLAVSLVSRPPSHRTRPLLRAIEEDVNVG